MIPLDEVKRRLSALNLRDVSRATGIHYNIVYRIARGITPDPRYSTVETLAGYLSTSAVTGAA